MSTERPIIFVARPLGDEAIARLDAVGEVDQWTESATAPREVLLERASRATGLLVSVSEQVDVELVQRSPKLKVVSNVAVGVDNLDLAALTARGIPAGHTPGVLSEATADVAFGLLIAVARRIVESRDAILAGEWVNWSPNFFLGQELSGSTLGIVGLGRIGEAMARRARGFNMRVVAWSRSRRVIDGVEWADLETVLRESDFVSLHVALTPETYHLLDASTLAMMKPSAILINTARGAIVDQTALVDALERDVIGGAGLDVFESEPIGPGDPLLRFSNVLAIPHIGSATTVTRRAMAELAVDNLIAGLEGRALPACANPEVYNEISY